MSDIEIANSVLAKPISSIAEQLGIPVNRIEQYGSDKAKLPLDLIDETRVSKSTLILVSAISPTPAGEGKTTTSIGLSEGLNRIGKKSTVVLREPSLGPVFGMKGGATGGGYSQVIPMEDINLHFTGDFSAIEKANNLLAALIDNNIQSKKYSLNIDPRTVRWKRVMDMNDRALRNVIVGLGGAGMGIPRESGFDITAASEIMAILCLSNSLSDLKERMGNILVGYTADKAPVYARDLNAPGAMAALLKDAIKPNLVQTLEGNPAIIHGGPFANIAQGTNSVLATKMGMSLSDYVVTEAGFGFDLGAEKFLNIKCRAANLSPRAVVIVATIRALKYHGGIAVADLASPNAEAVKRGFENMEKHLENAQKFNLSSIVAINRFKTDTQEELDVVIALCEDLGVEVSLCDHWERGGEGAEDLARKLVQMTSIAQGVFRPTYSLDMSPKEKIGQVAQQIYGAATVTYSDMANADLKRIEQLGLNHLPICVAKTQSSFSDNPKSIGRADGFELKVNKVELAAGAGFIIPITGKMMRMPGLPSKPAAEQIDVDDLGEISGLF
ncbi:MAG: formate--tetrahydrofolate ligase [Salibacteraceae bacterium]